MKTEKTETEGINTNSKVKNEDILADRYSEKRIYQKNDKFYFNDNNCTFNFTNFFSS